jgi:predicted aspartyl protease
MTRHPFDRQYNPPTPILPVIFSAAAEELRIGPLTAIVDTGADVTLVPTAYLRRIAAPVIAEAYARGVWGERRLVPVYLVDITMGSNMLPGIYAVGDDLGDEIILGRNVLNQMRLLLDGPAELTEVMES